MYQIMSRAFGNEGEPRLALDKRPCGDIVAVEMQKIEEEIHQLGRVAGV